MINRFYESSDLLAPNNSDEESQSDFLSVIPTRDCQLADYSYEIIMDSIREFEANLDEEHEVALKLASFGRDVTLAVTDIGYANPSTLIFSGFVGGQPAALIQHVSQLNFLLMSVPKNDPEKPPRRIGFETPHED